MSVRRTIVAGTSVLVATLLPALAHAGHPMLSEDTGTQGAGNAELELGYAWSRGDPGRSFLFQPQLSYGTSPSLDLIVQPSWLLNRMPDDQRTSGLGDTNLDLKWRFFGAAPYSLAVRTGLDLPTAQHDLGIPHGTLAGHALLAATVDAEPFTIDANLGYTRNPVAIGQRSALYHASAAVMLASSERLFWVVDTGIDSNPDATNNRWPAVILGGVIYTARPGLDLDAGYRAGCDPQAVSQEWLLGITYRWAP